MTRAGPAADADANVPAATAGRVAADRAAADRVAAAGWAALLPAHRADGDDQPVGPPRCVSLSRLGPALALAVLVDDLGRAYPAPVVLDADGVRRAVPGDGAADALLEALASGHPARGDLRLTAWHADRATGERGFDVDQTNESVVVGGRAVVKWTFLAEGPHPAPSLLAALDAAGFTGMPRPWGAVQWQPDLGPDVRPGDRSDDGPDDGPPGGEPLLVALVSEYVPGAVDGWTWLVDDLRLAAAADDDAVPVAAGTAVGGLLASFHRALAGTSRPAAPEEAAAWRSGAHADLDRALEVSTGPAYEVVRDAADRVRAAFDEQTSAGARVMRVHGDLHVGQVLRTDEAAGTTYLLTDFDGNPVVAPADRAREQPAALDVAGMAQSFVHAGLVVRRHHPDLGPAAVDRAAAAGREAFLEAYRRGLGDHADLLDERLLRPFALRQVCREFVYAATHLPRWSYVPEAALPMLLSEAPS